MLRDIRWDEGGRHLSDRKVRLIACAIARKIAGGRMDPRSLRAIAQMETRLDQGRYTLDQNILADAAFAWEELWHGSTQDLPVLVAAGLASRLETANLAWTLTNGFHLGRIDGPRSPYLTELDPFLMRHPEIVQDLLGYPEQPIVCDPAWLGWRDCLLWSMAEEIIVQRRFEDLPILADALEEAGCTEPLLLNHLRDPGPHFRGCWALDLLLDREPRDPGGGLVLRGPLNGQAWTLRQAVETEGRRLRQGGGQPRYARLQVRISPLDEPAGLLFRISPNLQSTQDNPERFFPAITLGLRQGLHQYTTPFDQLDIELQRVWIHPVDSTPIAFERAAAIAIQETLATTPSVHLSEWHSG